MRKKYEKKRKEDPLSSIEDVKFSKTLPTKDLATDDVPSKDVQDENVRAKDVPDDNIPAVRKKPGKRVGNFFRQIFRRGLSIDNVILNGVFMGTTLLIYTFDINWVKIN